MIEDEGQDSRPGKKNKKKETSAKKTVRKEQFKTHSLKGRGQKQKSCRRESYGPDKKKGWKNKIC